MSTVISALRDKLAVSGGRRTARYLAAVSFCDGCAQVCDAACRAQAHLRRTQALLTGYGLPR